jgi:hypothetical protein
MIASAFVAGLGVYAAFDAASVGSFIAAALNAVLAVANLTIAHVALRSL